MPRARTIRLSLALLCLAAAPARAKTIDTWIAPIFTGNIPLHDQENGFVGIKANPRVGFRFESGLMEDGISVDFRANVLSYYTDYALVFRYFHCLNQGGTTLLCPGLGVGGSFSPGIVGDATDRKFFDLILNPYLRIAFDTQDDIAFFVEGGAVIVPARSFSTGSPEVDKRAKIRPELAVGMMLNFDSVQSTLLDSSANAADAEEESIYFGIRGGIANSKLSSDTVDTKYKAGLLGGVGLQFGTHPINVSLDVFFANRRFDLGPTLGTTAANSLELPLLVKYRTAGATYANIGAGGYFTKSLADGGGTDYGIASMIGVGVASRIVTLEFDLRVNFGLKESGGAKSNTWDLVAGFMF